MVTNDELSDLVELVLATRCGADVHARDAAGNNALHLAVTVRGNGPTLAVNHTSARRARIVAALLASGAALNARTPAGDTALHLPCAAGDAKVVEVLLSKGASADVRNATLRTPRHAAVAGRAFPGIVTLLLDAGAHTSPRDVEGATPLHLIRETRTQDALSLLLDAGADPFAASRKGDTPLHRAVRRGNVTVAQPLLGVGADPAARGCQGRICLHVAARYGHTQMVEELGTARCGLDAVDAMGWTAAHHAAAKGHERTLTRLLAMGSEQGVDVFGGAAGAVPRENAVSRDEADRLRRLHAVDGRNTLPTLQTAVAVH